MALIVNHLLGLGFLCTGAVCLAGYDSRSGLGIKFIQDDLQTMRSRWGVMPGTVLHVLAYVVAPVGFGILFLMGYVF